MTSISDRCKTAREGTTPGRWEVKEESHTENETGAFSLEEWVEADGQYLFGNANDSVLLDYPGNIPLAALAPEAADEVVRLTDALEDMRERCVQAIGRIQSKDQITPIDGARLSELGRKLSGLNHILNPNGDTND